MVPGRITFNEPTITSAVCTVCAIVPAPTPTLVAPARFMAKAAAWLVPSPTISWAGLIVSRMPVTSFEPNPPPRPSTTQTRITQLNLLPVVVIVSFPCMTPLMLTNASDTDRISEPLPFTINTSRQ
jgi:hypothetical protein